MRQAFQAVPAWKDHLKANASLKARLDAVFGTAGLEAWASWCVWFSINSLLRCQLNPPLHFFSHEIIRRPLFRRVDRAYLSWPSAPLQQSRKRHMRLGGRRSICLCNRRFRIQVACLDFWSLTDFRTETGYIPCSYIWNAAQNASTNNSLTFGNRAPTHTSHSTVQSDQCPHPH